MIISKSPSRFFGSFIITGLLLVPLLFLLSASVMPAPVAAQEETEEPVFSNGHETENLGIPEADSATETQLPSEEDNRTEVAGVSLTIIIFVIAGIITVAAVIFFFKKLAASRP